MDKNLLKDYLKENKATLIAIIIIIVTSIIICTQGAAFWTKKNSSSNTQNDIKTQEFIVFDYEEQKLKTSQATETETLEITKNENIKIDTENTKKETKVKNDTNLLTEISLKKDKITFNVKTGGRKNPFSPYIERSLTPDGRFDIVEPPQYIPDELVDEDLMKTTVSGILYNDQKSSAIINVNGTDHLVNKDDKIAGFQIANITKNKVYVKKRHNVISAGVGESIEAPELTYNEIYDLSSKFGGKYETSKKEVILINGKEY